MIELAQQYYAEVLLVGIQLPPNYGPAYTDAFFAMYPRLSEKYDTVLVPFLLDGFAENWSYFQSDGIHPNPQGHKLIAKNLYPYFKKLF